MASPQATRSLAAALAPGARATGAVRASPSDVTAVSTRPEPCWLHPHTTSSTTSSLQGGFLAAFQKTTGPGLTLMRSYDTVIANWPTNAGTGFHLEASADLNGPWVDFGEGWPTGSDRFVAVGLSAP